MKKKITFYSPGTFVSETNVEEIEGKNLQEIITNSVLYSKSITQRYGAVPYGFTVQNEKGIFFLPHMMVETVDEIKNRKDVKDKILISNMENNHWKSIVTTNQGWKISQPFQDDDCIVDIFGNIILHGYEVDIKKVRRLKIDKIIL